MTKTAVIFSPKYYEHNPGKDHPESAKRLHAMIDELKKGKLSNSRNWQFVSPVKASVEDVELIHGIEYIRLVEAVCKSGGGLLDLEDTVVSPKSFETALYAVGGTLKAVDLVIGEKFKNAFALVRPPGHHAAKFRACGFCLFNNVAVAAEHLLKKYKLKRVLILDIDAHHGNGTQESFYETDKVLYISLHEDPRGFPGTGFADEIGESEGLGYNINIPLPFRTGDRIYLKVVDEIVTTIVRQYKPQFMLVSAGLDGHYTDPVGNLGLSALCYQQVYEIIMKLAIETCNEKIVSVLEGGYSLNYVGRLSSGIIAETSKTPFAASDKIPVAREKIEKQGEKIINEVKRIQRVFWNVD